VGFLAGSNSFLTIYAMNRDVNAAINLRNYAVSSTVSACGGEGSGRRRKMTVKPAPAKQEANSKSAHG
jgi:putative transposase